MPSRGDRERLSAASNRGRAQLGVQDLFSAAVVDWGLVMAAGMLITIPALAFFMAVQRHLVAGWGTGGLKG